MEGLIEEEEARREEARGKREQSPAPAVAPLPSKEDIEGWMADLAAKQKSRLSDIAFNEEEQERREALNERERTAYRRYLEGGDKEAWEAVEREVTARLVGLYLQVRDRGRLRVDEQTARVRAVNLEKRKAENEALVESGAADLVLGKLKEDRAYQNAMANSDAQNTKIEYDRALERAMVGLLDEGHIDLFKRYSDDPDFRERLDNHLETRAPREAGDTPAPPEPAPTATIEPLDWEYIERPLAAKRHTFAPSDDMRNDIVLTGKLFENRLWVKRDDGKMAGAYYPPSDVRYESLDEAQKAAEQHYREWVASGEPIPPIQQYAGGGPFGGGRKLSIDEMVVADEQNAKAKVAEEKKAARRVKARDKRERERPAKLAAHWAEPSEQSQSDLDKNLAKLRSIDESDFPTGEKDRIVAVWEKAVAEADDDAPKTKREKRETVPRPDPTPDRATAEQIAHIKALYAVHPDSYGETEGPPSIAGALVYEANTTMGQREARDGIRRLTDVLKHHPPFGPPNDLRREGSTGRD
jgi:hypothetical protein